MSKEKSNIPAVLSGEKAVATDDKNANLVLYNIVRTVPHEAQKTIKGGRLNGFTDINPMWRIMTLTEHFGMCGFGWYFNITRMWTENGANNEVAAFVEIDLFVKYSGEWSKPIKGVGGSSFISKEKNGLYTNDEAYKMALTDAISVSCKALGFGADIYFDKDNTKYSNSNSEKDSLPTDAFIDNAISVKILTDKQLIRLHAIRKSVNMDEATLQKILQKHFKKSSSKELTKKENDFICGQLENIKKQQKNPA